jgi:ribonuclease Z
MTLLLRNVKYFSNFMFIGRSAAGFQTAIYVPQLRLSFDMGFVSPDHLHANTICISHGHADHVGALHLHAFGRRLRYKSLSVPTYIMPRACIETFHKAHDAYKRLNRHICDESLAQWLTRQYECRAADNEHPLRSDFVIRSFPMKHVVPAVGYCVFRKKSKLRAEYARLEKEEIKKLAIGGEAVSEIVYEPFLSYSGDTTIEGLRAHTCFLESHILLVECTYLHPDAREEANRRGHIHEEDLYTLDFSRVQHLVIFHLSMRYSDQDIEKFHTRLETKLGEQTSIYIIPWYEK